jgi:hypothetical protein
MNKRKKHILKFTQRQLELIVYACELAQCDRTRKDQLTLSSVYWKINNLQLPNFDNQIKTI